eukprot:GEMP01016675.1.p1 GENE.GEMP01016675.1~~GEMP01016675.1.p1  ORF type:complete len:922 (+),score=204.55 GEMP01016675.1:2-2767(+)
MKRSAVEEIGPRPKRQEVSSAHKTRSSALLRPVRTIGVVTTGIPFALQKLGQTDFAAVSVGKQFHVFNLVNLRLAFISPTLTEKVRCLHWVGETVLTALKHDIVVFHKLTEIVRLKGHHGAPRLMASIGGAYVVSSTGPETLVWNVHDNELLKVENATRGGQMDVAPSGRLDVSNVTALCHPPTYLNKMLVGTAEGKLHLFNVKTLNRIHTFNLPEHGAITCVAAAPNQLDIVAVGFVSGHICVLNAKTDTVLATFIQAQGSVLTLSFRNDGHPNLVSGSSRGVLCVWDLEQRSLTQEIDGHEGPLASAMFVEGQPLLLSSGHDNALVLRVFDTADGRCRLLRQRRGFAGSIRRLRFYNDKGLDLICTSDHHGTGLVGQVSTIQQHQNKVFAQSCVFKNGSKWTARASKLPPVHDVSFASIRHYDWPSIVSCHEGLSEAYVWSAPKSALVPKKLTVPNNAGGAVVTALSVSECGNYAVVGLENGAVHRFNVQSQRHQSQFLHNSRRAHANKVALVHIMPNLEVVTVGANEKKMRIWKLREHELLHTIALQDGALRGVVHGSLVALATHHGVTIVDTAHRHVVRRFPVNNIAFVTDMAFSPDGRWLAVSTNEGRLCIFDLAAARCIDTIRFRSPALSLAFCPSGTYLFTSHANGKGAVRVWANKMLFDVSLLALAENKEVAIDEPCEANEDSDVEEDAGEINFSFSSSAEPLEPGALTLSTMPETQWKHMLHLDAIKERNRPIAAHTTRKKAPFFLPTAVQLGNVQKNTFVALPEDGASRIMHFAGPAHGSGKKGGDDLPLVRLLREAKYEDALVHVMAQTASGAHLCWSEMGEAAGGDNEDLTCAAQFFKYHMNKNHHADLLQTYLNLFIKFHGDVLRQGMLSEDIAELLAKQKAAWNKVDLQCQKILCFLKMITQTQAQW